VFNRIDQVKIRVAARSAQRVACTVTLKYRGKVFGGGSFSGPAINQEVTVRALADSRTRTTHGIEAALKCAPTDNEGGVVFAIPIQARTTEGP
jgi:hypothetical protein